MCENILVSVTFDFSTSNRIYFSQYIDFLFWQILSIKIGHKLSRSIFELFLNEVLIERYGHYLLSARLSWVLVFMAVLTFPQAVTLARGPVTQAGGNQHQYHFKGLRLALSTFICQIHRGWSITAFVTRFHLFCRA